MKQQSFYPNLTQRTSGSPKGDEVSMKLWKYSSKEKRNFLADEGFFVYFFFLEEKK
jgi:hypothetical protein